MALASPAVTPRQTTPPPATTTKVLPVPEALRELPASWGDAQPSQLEGPRPRFRVLEHLSTTSFSAVYVAEDRLGRDVVIKIARQLDGESEARMLAILEHPHIVRVLSLETIDGYMCTVLERCLQGDLLSYALDFPWWAVVDRGVEVARALEFIHERDVVHGDVKPGNVLIHEGRAKLCDFGFARRLTQQGPRGAGTAPYTPPERFAGRWEPSGDLFSLALTLQACLKVARGAPAPERVMEVIERGLAPMPELRPSVSEWAEQLIAARESGSVRRSWFARLFARRPNATSPESR